MDQPVLALLDHSQLALLMLFIGLALLIAEIFVPSGGMITILAVICIAVSVWAAYQAWWETNRSFWWWYIATLVLLVPASVGGALFMLQRTRLGKHILLDAPSLEEVTPYVEEENQLKQLIGKRAKTLSLLNPGGMVSLEGERFHCESPGMLIEAGEEVEVTGVKGNRLVVRPAPDRDDDSSGETGAEPQSPDDLPPEEFLADSDRRDQAPLDFEFPQS